MSKFIKITNKYGSHETIYINVDKINCLKEAEPDDDEAYPPIEICLDNCTIYAEEPISYILSGIM